MTFRRLPTSFAAILITALISACGSGSPTGPTATAASSTRIPISLSVMTFNVHHGIDASGRYNLQRAIDAIAAIQPDVVGLQEVTRNHPTYGCEDQPQRIASGLKAATGQAWNVAYQQEWFTSDVSCQASGRGTGPETEGLVLLSRRMVTSPTFVTLPDSRIGFGINVLDAYSLPIVVTHLTAGGSEAATRQQQIDRLTSWARGLGEPRIVMGDFNVGPQGPELQPLFSGYHDAWTDAAQKGGASGSGSSHSGSRVDFIFYAPGNGLTVQAAQVADSAVAGVQASDHQPVLATFTIR